MARSVAPPHVLNIGDLRRLAKRRLPRVVFDYIDGGADAEVTLRDNVKAYEELTFRPRGAVAIPSIDLKTTILGAQLELPFILAPVGSTRLFYPNGEVLAARAAGKAGTAYVLSTLSGTPMEQVRAATSGPAWYQVYLCGGREASINMLKRAKAAGFTALVVTIDTGVPGLRERDLRNGIKELLGRGVSGLPYLGQMITRPAWIAGMLADGGLMKFPNVLLPTGPMPYADVGKTLEESVVCWDDLKWIRDLWDGKIVVKGVHTAEDAERVVAEGADALIVSNHGGRQLDGVPGSIRSLPEVLAAARQDRGARRRRHPQRRGRRKSVGPGREGRAYRPCVCVRTCRRRGDRRFAVDRDPSLGYRADDEAARRGVGAGLEPVVHRRAGRLAPGETRH